MSESTPSFGVLLWRYFSFGWLLQQASGDPWQDLSLRDSNRQRLSRHLPTYIRRHIFMLAAAMASLALMQESSMVALPASWMGAELTLVLGMTGALFALRFGPKD